MTTMQDVRYAPHPFTPASTPNHNNKFLQVFLHSVRLSTLYRWQWY